MKENSNLKTQISKLIASSLICLVLGSLAALPTNYTLAQTNEADPKAIETIRKSVEEKVQSQNEADQNEKRAFFGQIADLFNQTIVLETSQGKKTAKTDEETIIIDRNRKEITFEDLEIGNFMLAMGYLEAPEKLTTKRVVVTPKPGKVTRTAIIGRVIDINKSVFNLEALRDEATWKVTTDSQTGIAQKVDGTSEEITLGKIEEGDLLIVAGPSENENEITAKAILLLSSAPSSPPEEVEEEEIIDKSSNLL